MKWKIDILDTKTGEIDMFKENEQINENYNLPTLGGLSIANGSAKVIANGIETPLTRNDVSNIFTDYITYAKSDSDNTPNDIARLNAFKRRTLKKID